MIYYDSHRWTTLLRLHGSVLPKAMCWALPSAILAFLLKWAEDNGYVSLDFLTVLLQGDIYSGFTYVLGFSLVFRTSQAYSRYWTACTAVHEMASEWSDSCASLIAFSSISPANPREILIFRHTIVRLFSLLHAMALSEISETDAEMPLLDVEGLSRPQLALLASPAAQGKTVQIILCWIKAYVTQMANKGILDVPAPLLTRVFQEFGAGLVKFHSAQQVGVWPFPFPYTQLTVILIQVYTFTTPLVISTWRTFPIVCAVFCFISVTCMVGIDLIACELEDPFGDDPNDLPLHELQGDMNKFLTMQLDPAVNNPPELLATAVLDHKELAFACSNSISSRLTLKTLTRRWGAHMLRRDRLRKYKRWCGEESRSHDVHRIQRWLNVTHSSSSMAKLSTLSSAAGGAARLPEDFVMTASERSYAGVVSAPYSRGNSVGNSIGANSPESPTRSGPPESWVRLNADDWPECRGVPVPASTSTPPSQWNKFLDAQHLELRAALETRADNHRRELGAVEALLRHLSTQDETAASSPRSASPLEQAALLALCGRGERQQGGVSGSRSSPLPVPEHSVL